VSEANYTAKDKLRLSQRLLATRHRMVPIPESVVNSEKTLRRLIIVALLYCIPASQAMVPLVDPDIWWHLRTGQWIIEHAQVPGTDPFSAYGTGNHWVA
jgi:hypothetical protein